MTVRFGFAWWAFSTGEAAHDDALLERAANMGLRAVDFLPPELWNRAKSLGLEVAIIDGHASVDDGFARPESHEALQAEVAVAIGAAKAAGIPFVSVLPGRASGDPLALADAVVAGLTPLIDVAERAGTTMLLEPLNSVRDHPGHFCDTTEIAAAIVNRIQSDRLGLLLDAYHAAVMGEDPTATWRRHRDSILHIHVAGTASRSDPRASDTVDWPRFFRVLDEDQFEGVVSFEFNPSGAADESLARAFAQAT